MKAFLPITALALIVYVAIFAYVKEDGLGAALEPTVTTAQQEEDKAHATYGEYVQVLKDGSVPDGKQFDRRRLPPNSYVNVYDSPQGKGWQIVTEFSDRTEYKGYGPQAQDYTYTLIKGSTVATST